MTDWKRRLIAHGIVLAVAGAAIHAAHRGWPAFAYVAGVYALGWLLVHDLGRKKS